MVQGADMIIAASLCFGLSSLAEALRTPYRFIAFTPQLLPSGYHPYPAFRHQCLCHWCNRAGWRLAKAMDRLNLTQLVNAYRREMGLLPVRDLLAHILGPRVIVASDAAVAAVPPDIKTEYIQTGYMHLDQPEQPMPELENFLAAGMKPIYAGFGSMPPRDQARLVPLIVKAARSAGRRVVISRFWQEPQAKEFGDDVFFIHKCPHRQLFPKMAAIVHHGGSGTTATAAISGIPQVIVPHILDQYYWGEQIRRSGLGPPPVWRSRITAANLGQAIQDCIGKRTYQQRAKLVEQTIRRGNGVRQAMQAILAR
jgi:UDP:flavonoid glycosyltransferase YjiC (YdhE family)